MGENTFRTFPAPLKDRLNVVFSESDNLPQAGVKWVKGDPVPVLAELEQLGYKSALLGGGSFLNSMFLEKKLIKEIILTVEPKIFGTGLSLFNRDLNATLKLLEVKNLNPDTLMLRYQVLY
jgi:dihydrofolate reductase